MHLWLPALELAKVELGHEVADPGVADQRPNDRLQRSRLVEVGEAREEERHKGVLVAAFEPLELDLLRACEQVVHEHEREAELRNRNGCSSG